MVSPKIYNLQSLQEALYSVQTCVQVFGEPATRELVPLPFHHAVVVCECLVSHLLERGYETDITGCQGV